MEVIAKFQGISELRITRTTVERKPVYSVEYRSDYSLNEWDIMGGSVGFDTSEFRTLKEAVRFVARGLANEKANPDIWLEMLLCPTRRIK